MARKISLVAACCSDASARRFLSALISVSSDFFDLPATDSLALASALTPLEPFRIGLPPTSLRQRRNQRQARPRKPSRQVAT